MEVLGRPIVLDVLRRVDRVRGVPSRDTVDKSMVPRSNVVRLAHLHHEDGQGWTSSGAPERKHGYLERESVDPVDVPQRVQLR